VYYLNDAFGHKIINNFATDEVFDLVIANKSLSKNVCYHFLDTDLQINFNFDIFNSTEAFSRLVADTAFLMVTIPFWLENTTYQHIAFSFKDSFSSLDDYEEECHQIQSVVDIVNNGSLLWISSVGIVACDLSCLDVSTLCTDSINIHLAHFQSNSVNYSQLSLNSPLPTQLIMTFQYLSAGAS
jgi:hypothetical protein